MEDNILQKMEDNLYRETSDGWPFLCMPSIVSSTRCKLVSSEAYDLVKTKGEEPFHYKSLNTLPCLCNSRTLPSPSNILITALHSINVQIVTNCSDCCKVFRLLQTVKIYINF